GLRGAAVAEVVAERDVVGLAVATAVAGAAVRTLDDQAVVVDVLAPVAVDQHVVAGRAVLVGGEGLHAIGVRAVLVARVVDRVVPDLDVVAPEPDAITVVVFGRVDGGVLQRDVVALERGAGGWRAIGDEPVDHDVVGSHRNALDVRTALAEHVDRRRVR